MTFAKWHETYEIGVAEIDAEHRHLFYLLNELHEAQNQGENPEKSAMLLNRLVGHAQEHFRNEETLMSEIGYPLLEEHRKAHAELASSVDTINAWIGAEPAAANAKVLDFLRRWLVEHIVKQDADIGAFMKRASTMSGGEFKAGGGAA